MSTHSYSRIWIHLIWETLARGTYAGQALPRSRSFSSNATGWNGGTSETVKTVTVGVFCLGSPG